MLEKHKNTAESIIQKLIKGEEEKPEKQIHKIPQETKQLP